MLTNSELKRLKPKLDIVKKPENRVHELTDSNVSLSEQFEYKLDLVTQNLKFRNFHVQKNAKQCSREK